MLDIWLLVDSVLMITYVFFLIRRFPSSVSDSPEMIVSSRILEFGLVIVFW
ncbi:hypothetical protein Hanom_Chr04g00281841 [Helianthus anomalus]